tara:strand:- start:233 stop:514 length:282 start_codon:yes stop_codon:yes gene_type:complete
MSNLQADAAMLKELNAALRMLTSMRMRLLSKVRKSNPNKPKKPKPKPIKPSKPVKSLVAKGNKGNEKFLRLEAERLGMYVNSNEFKNYEQRYL